MIRYAAIVERIVAFKMNRQLGTGGGIIRPDGFVIPVSYYGHADALATEIVDKGLVEDEDLPHMSLDIYSNIVTRNGYVIVHNAKNMGWIIEYDDSAVDRGNLRELLDYFIENNENEFTVYKPQHDEADTVEELERVFRL